MNEPALSFGVDRGPEPTDRDLARIAQLVSEHSGIRLHEGKRALVTARLQKRVRLGGFRTFRAYLRCVEADSTGTELTALLDAITTNHTSLFREPQHFAFLRDVVLPPLMDRPEMLTGWSAACATGEEPYSIAITLFEALGDHTVARARLLASDLSTRALATAKAGIYKADRVAHLPAAVQRRYFERGIGSQQGHVRASAALRGLIEFCHHNLLDAPPPGPFQFIFCRNVMIYFDEAEQKRLVEKFYRCLTPEGFLFVGHAESLFGLSDKFKMIHQNNGTAYQRVEVPA